MDLVGLCGTDLQILNGSRPGAARILGHEGTGIVTAVGDGRPDQLLGKRVVFNPVNPLGQDMVLGHSYDGLFQERFIVPRHLVSAMLIDAGANIHPPLAALAEPVASVIYGQELATAMIGGLRRILVIGAGPIGLIHAICARQKGGRIILVHRSAARLAWARDAGLVQADEVVDASMDPEPHRIADAVRARAGGEVEAAFICTTRSGAPHALRVAMDCVVDGGLICLVSGMPQGHPLNAVRRQNVCGRTSGPALAFPLDVAGKRLSVTGHRGTAARHLTLALQRLREHPQPFLKLVTHVVPLSEAPERILALLQGTNRQLDGRECVKLVVSMNGDKHLE